MVTESGWGLRSCRRSRQRPAPRHPTRRRPFWCRPGGRTRSGHSGLLLRPRGTPWSPPQLPPLPWPLLSGCLALRPGHLLAAGGPRGPCRWLLPCTAGCCVPAPGRSGHRPAETASPAPLAPPPGSGFARCTKRPRRTLGSRARRPRPAVRGCVLPPPTWLDPSAPAAGRLGRLPWVPLLEPRCTAGTGLVVHTPADVALF